jgi:hypothetical protein
MLLVTLYESEYAALFTCEQRASSGLPITLRDCALDDAGTFRRAVGSIEIMNGERSRPSATSMRSSPAPPATSLTISASPRKGSSGRRDSASKR